MIECSPLIRLATHRATESRATEKRSLKKIEIARD